MNTATKLPEIPRTPDGDWDPAYIYMRVRVAGWTWARIARAHGYAVKGPPDVLRRKWLAMERIVGAILGEDPAEIWPSRYRPGVRRYKPGIGTTRRIEQD